MGLFEKLPYTNFHRVNLEWIVKKLKEMDTKLDEIISDHDAVVDLQSRMTTAEGNITNLSGRVTTLEGNVSGLTTRIGTAETKLGKIPLPEAGDIGKVLGAVADGSGAKLSYVTDQTGGDVPTPAAGDNGKVLTAGSGGTYSWEAVDTGNDVPTPAAGDNGKVLTAGSGGSYSWQTAGGGSNLSLECYRAGTYQAGDGTSGYFEISASDTDFPLAKQEQFRADLTAAWSQGAYAVQEYLDKHIYMYVAGHRLLWAGEDPLGSVPGSIGLNTTFLWYVNVNNVMTEVVFKPELGINFSGTYFTGFTTKNCILPGTGTSLTPTDVSGILPPIKIVMLIYM